MKIFVIAFIVSYLYHGLGITLGYHRLLAHRSFTIPRWFEYLLISGGYLCFEGSPIFWVTTHRLHHRYSDQPGDPHSPRDGLWHALIGWMYRPLVRASVEESRVISPDMHRDPVYTFLDAGHSNWHALLCLACCFLFRAVILFWFGMTAFLANLAAAACTFMAPLIVNSFGHLSSLGYQNFDTGENSRNVRWIALLSLGEGWHNNHHALPQSARHGLKPSEFDLSWCALLVLQKLGVVSKIRLGNVDKLAEMKVTNSHVEQKVGKQ